MMQQGVGSAVKGGRPQWVWRPARPPSRRLSGRLRALREVPL